MEIKANNGEAIENKLIRGEIKGMKTDENGTGLEGAVIGLFREDETEFTAENAILTATSLEDGSFSFEGVPYGNWLLKEVQGVTGFALSDEAFPVTIDEDGAVVEIAIENQRIYGNLRLTKVDKDYPGNKLTGAEFEVYRDSNGNQELDEEDELLGLMEETSTGIYEMTHVEYGGVFVKESKAPDSFLLDENAYKTATTIATIAQTAFNASVNAFPLMWILTGIGLLIQGINWVLKGWFLGRFSQEKSQTGPFLWSLLSNSCLSNWLSRGNAGKQSWYWNPCTTPIPEFSG